MQPNALVVETSAEVVCFGGVDLHMLEGCLP